MKSYLTRSARIRPAAMIRNEQSSTSSTAWALKRNGMIQVSSPNAPSNSSRSNRSFHSSLTLSASFPKANIPEWSSEQAKEAVEGLINKFYPSSSESSEASSESSIPNSTILPATSFIQTFDSNQLNLLRTLLDEIIPLSDPNSASASASVPSSSKQQTQPFEQESQLSDPDSILSPSDHLVYFTPLTRTSTLGKDGSDTTFNPPGGIFVRRMWAGGQMKWTSTEGLSIGDKVKEDTFIEEISVKRLKDENEMLVVWVRKEYRKWNEKDHQWSQVLLIDRRSWVYQTALSTSKDSSSIKSSDATKDPSASQNQNQNQSQSQNQKRSDVLPASFTNLNLNSTSQSSNLIQSPTHLFRYSALTYNGHAIHLCPIWAKEKEGHKERVVHGPLNLNLIMRQFEKKFKGERKIEEVEYRARNPVYVGEEYRIRFKENGSGNEEGLGGRMGDELEIVKMVEGKEILVMEAKVYSTRI